jgi:hypothetical protein
MKIEILFFKVSNKETTISPEIYETERRSKRKHMYNISSEKPPKFAVDRNM